MKVNGLIKIDNINVNNITGGFENDERCILAKDIAKLHGVQTFKLNELIKRNMLPNKNNFIIGVDIIDLKLCNSLAIPAWYSQIFSKDEINASKNIWLLSQRGYIKLVAAMSNNNTKKWEVMNKLIDDYFSMKDIIIKQQQIINSLQEEVTLKELAMSMFTQTISIKFAFKNFLSANNVYKKLEELGYVTRQYGKDPSSECKNPVPTNLVPSDYYTIKQKRYGAKHTKTVNCSFHVEDELRWNIKGIYFILKLFLNNNKLTINSSNNIKMLP